MQARPQELQALQIAQDYKGLKPGKHVFKVRAAKGHPTVDPTPAKRKFKVLG